MPSRQSEICVRWTRVLAAALLLCEPVRGSCPCLSASATRALLSEHYVDDDGDLKYERYTYPIDYGADSCKTHDTALPPYCAKSGGDARSNRPEWCSDVWCWVDPDVCDSAVVTRSAYFPKSDLYFSYQACGAANTFSNWFHDAGNASSTRTIEDVVELVENYVFSIRDHIESELTAIADDGSCSMNSCDCDEDTCKTRKGWGDEPVDLSATMFKTDADENKTKLSECMASVASSVFNRVAGLEYADATRPGFLYAGFQSDGAYAQWPRMDWCDSFDPRFRPWYAAAATAPKNLVLVVDTSGSMAGNRIELAQSAVKAVADTLTWKDRATLITFNDGVSVYSEELLVMDDEGRGGLKAEATVMRADGGTAFQEPLSTALDILESADNGACHNAILFMTDGQATFSNADFEDVRERAEASSVVLFTYALGNEASTEVIQRLACDSNGVAHKVGDDGDNLASAMSSYYTYYTAGTEYRGARWIKYTDVTMGEELFAACTAIYDGRGSNSDLNVLLGVACMDVNMVVGLDTLQTRSDYDDFLGRVNEVSEGGCDLFTSFEGEALNTALEKVVPSS
mmetsp:Transcript_2887/g.8347  ORF Transcript_2887/g.8347 Transcript_2887/m.8347 type:complete len:572 (+) Transcript_2887:167-1882(+)